MITPHSYLFGGNISTSSCASEDAFYAESILKGNGRISLAYENLQHILRRLADKFAPHTKYLDLSNNDFRNLQFLFFFENLHLHTLILDRNVNLNLNTLPYLPSLTILWINNCRISKITDWIHRIDPHCPALEQLSCMGNPGTSTVFSSHGPATTAARDYILQLLPNVKYLDGLPRIMPNSGSASEGRKSATSVSNYKKTRHTNLSL